MPFCCASRLPRTRRPPRARSAADLADRPRSVGTHLRVHSAGPEGRVLHVPELARIRADPHQGGAREQGGIAPPGRPEVEGDGVPDRPQPERPGHRSGPARPQERLVRVPDVSRRNDHERAPVGRSQDQHAVRGGGLLGRRARQGRGADRHARDAGRERDHDQQSRGQQCSGGRSEHEQSRTRKWRGTAGNGAGVPGHARNVGCLWTGERDGQRRRADDARRDERRRTAGLPCRRASVTYCSPAA